MRKIKTEYKVILIYLFIGFLWIIISDNVLVMYINDEHIRDNMQTYKGWFYVLASGLFMFFLLQRIFKNLRKSQQLAEESNRLKSAFLNNISHEFRTPMNGIIAFSELIILPEKTAVQREEYAHFIKKSCDQLLNVLTDTIEISQIQSQSMEMNKSTFRLAWLLNELIANTEYKIRKDKPAIVLKTNCSNANFLIHTDRYKLLRSLEHLIDNALKFTNTGYIELGCEITDQKICLSVLDTGIGIAPEILINAFESYRQAELGLTRNFGGVGLGLSLIKAYAEMLNGNVQIESEVNIGTKVLFCLPVSVIINEPNSDDAATYKLNWQSKTLLIADTHRLDVTWLKKCLAPTGISILHASNGNEIIEKCRNNATINLILVDLALAKEDNYKAIEMIKTFRKEIPVVVYTSTPKDRMNDLNNLHLFDDYLLKQNNKLHLIQFLQKYF